jgi:TolB-like protein
VDGRRASTPPATALLLPQIKQVAVLPFQVIGSAENTRTVADGLVEILAAALSDFEQFQGTITAVPSSEVRRRAIGSAEEARRVYGVNLVITGSAQPAGENIEFALNLVDAVTLRQIGAKTFVYDVRNPVGQINPHIRPIVMPALS